MLKQNFKFTKQDSKQMKFEAATCWRATRCSRRLPTSACSSTSTRRPYQVRRVLIIDAQGNRNRFDFLTSEVNTKAPQGEFAFTPPPGTQGNSAVKMWWRGGSTLGGVRFLSGAVTGVALAGWCLCAGGDVADRRGGAGGERYGCCSGASCCAGGGCCRAVAAPEVSPARCEPVAQYHVACGRDHRAGRCALRWLPHLQGGLQAALQHHGLRQAHGLNRSVTFERPTR